MLKRHFRELSVALALGLLLLGMAIAAPGVYQPQPLLSVVTLATMVTWREGLRWLRQGEFVNLPDNAQWFGLSQTAGQWTLIAAALALLVLMVTGMKNLIAGRLVYAVGGDAEAARLAGIR